MDGVAPLGAAAPGKLSFCTGNKHRKQLAATRATAVVLPRELAGECPVAALVSARPYAAWARIANGAAPAGAGARRARARGTGGPDGRRSPHPRGSGRTPSWAPAPSSASAARSAPNCVIEAGARLGDDCRLQAGVTLCQGVCIGARCLFKPGAVIGSDGFGHAPDVDGYVKVPQLGSVRIGDDVEVGANTTVDRGTIEDTVIGDGVKLDNQVQVGHNCRIGAHTVIAGCVGISGSSIIGSRCMIGGAVGIAGHLEIGDDVVVTGYSLVTHSLPGPGMYSSGMPAIEAGKWRRAVARLHRLDARRGRGGKGGQGDE